MTSQLSKFNKTIMREAEALSSVTRVWKFTAGHTGGRGFLDDFLNKKRIAIGYVYNEGLSHVENYHDLKNLRDYDNRKLSDNVQRQMWDFLWMKKGDIVALKLKKKIEALGIVSSGRLLYNDSALVSTSFRQEQTYPNRKKVFWLTKFKPQPIDGRDFTKSFRYPQDTIHEITERSSKDKILAWVVWYGRNVATKDEKKLIEQIGTVEKEREKLPRRIQTTKEIAGKEYAAMKEVIRFEEEKEHRKVTPVYQLSVGYDLESRSDKDTRYIEVKSRFGSYPVVLTETELKAARKLKNDYYLYVVTSANQMMRLQNPSSLRTKPLHHIVWELQDWASQATRIKI